MTIRSAPLLAAALACLATPVLAQDEEAVISPDSETAYTPLPPLPEGEAEPVTLASEPLPEPAPGGGWEGQWQGQWADDGSYQGTWTGTYSEPLPTAARAIYPGGVSTVAYSPERAAWLERCRSAYAAAGGSPGAAAAECEAHLLQYERTSAMPVQGASYAPGAYAPGGYGYPYAPVMWVRVPIIREAVAAAPADGVEE